MYKPFYTRLNAEARVAAELHNHRHFIVYGNTESLLIRLVLQLMLSRLWCHPISTSLVLREHQPITKRLESISLKSHLTNSIDKRLLETSEVLVLARFQQVFFAEFYHMGVKIGGEEISFLGDLDLNKMNTARDIWQIKYLSDVSIYITVRASFTDLNDKYSDF